jgi:hypothetical protein
MRSPLPPLAALTAGVLLMTGCSQPAETGAGEEAGVGAGPVQNQLSIATGGTAGVYYPIGGALSGIIGDNLDGQSGSVEATGASVENIRLIGSGSAHLAIVQGDAADQAANGTAAFEGNAIETYSLAVLYPNVFHAVTLDSIAESKGLECFSDVVGTRYSVGDVGSGALGYGIAALLMATWLQAGDGQPWLLILPASVFLVDTALTLAGRMLRRERWWEPHVQHAYQSWARGIDRHGPVTLAYAMATGGAVAAMLMARSFSAPVTIGMIAAAWLAGGAVWFRLQRLYKVRTR